MAAPNHYRAIWLADAHLGAPASEAAALLGFLRQSESEYLYLVGDMVEAEALQERRSWDACCNDIVAEVLRKAREGTRVVYLPGDADAFARAWLHGSFGGVTVQPHAIHVTADDRHLLVLHGDRFDRAARHVRWLAHLGARRWAGRLSRWYRHAYPGGGHAAGFETAIVTEARAWDVDGVVCGHARRAALRTTAGFLYANPGDWVDHCTALVEHAGGQLEVLHAPTAGGLRAVALGADGLSAEARRRARGAADPPRRAPFLAPGTGGGA